MKEKIKALFKEYYNDETMPIVELEDKVLALFDVMGSYNDGILFGINNCNAEFQVILQEIYAEFNNLKRINKINMVKILTNHCSKELGEDINPFLEDISE